ncbi:hypoxia up-regulated protein 1-like [Oppia nitens]|uniref:hypoxia up-regulated protein 1-like n=1 Tax=Oppia nitens TaxID=1686743 RepID=UPI0023DC8B82|nr:hypoxia up-regulated protein 1-like [Oppia nitens]
MFKLLSLLLLIVCQLTTNSVSAVAVMSVDLGSEWMKVAIVSPGVPMEIVLNTDSQRKTPVVVSFRDGERLFGDSAQTVATRFPDKAFAYFGDLVAKHRNSSSVQLFLKRFPYHKIDDTNNGVSLTTGDDLVFTPEELVSMVLTKAKKYAEETSKQPINDAVITVPPYFTQAERRAILVAADLAKLKVLQLVNSNTAFALNYGVFRRKDFNTTVTNILFYDMGAASTTATIVSYQLIKTKDRGFTETNPQLTVKGVGYDRQLGGLEMQLRLRDHLAKLFAEQSKKPLTDITGNHRAMAKLFKEAGRLKKVLSANTEHKAQVENVMNDIDLKAMVTREEFEQLCDDLFNERLTKPIDEAFKTSGYTLAEIDTVIIIGGNTRIPKIQTVLQKYFNRELSKSINADEGAALGAAYQAAYLSKGFKVKTFIVKDANLYPIQVDFERETEDGGSRKSLSRTLFARNNAYPQKKVLTFNKHTKDFGFSVNYGSKVEDYSTALFNVSLKGVSEAIGKHPAEDSKGIKAHFRMDESGLLNLESVEAVFESKVESEAEEVGNIVGDAISKFGESISKLFGSKDDEADVEKVNDTDTSGATNATANTTDNANQQQEANATSEAAPNKTESANATTNGTQSGAQKELKLKTIKEPIDTSLVLLDLPETDAEVLQQSRDKIKELDDKEADKLKRDKVKNTLESFILETRDKLDQEEYSSASTDTEKDTIQSKLSAESEWLEYESDGAETKVITDKLADLRSLTRALFDRVKEHRERPEALAAINNMLNISQMFYTGATNVSDDDQIFTEVELNTLKKLIDETKTWVDTSVHEQSKLAKHETPKLTLKSIAEKIAALDREVKYMLNKARITPPKRKPTEKPETTASDDDNSDDKNKTKSDEKSDDKEESETKPETSDKPETVEPSKDKLKDELPETKAERKLRDDKEDIKPHSSSGQTSADAEHSEL